MKLIDEKITHAIKDMAYHPHKIQTLEWTWKSSCAKKTKNNQRYACCLICLGNKDSMSYASKISNQQIFLPVITGWRSKQQYSRRDTHDQVIDTLLDKKEVSKDAIKELDQKLILHWMTKIQNRCCYHRQ